MSRDFQAAQRLEIGVGIPVELIGEQLLDLIAPIATGRQADRMQYDQIDVRAVWSDSLFGESSTLLERYQPSLHGEASAIRILGMASDTWRSRDAEPRDPIADLAKAQSQARCCCRTVEAGILQRTKQDLAFLLVQVKLKVIRYANGFVARGARLAGYRKLRGRYRRRRAGVIVAPRARSK